MALARARRERRARTRRSALRYQASQVGDVAIIGNTLGQDCRSQVPAPVRRDRRRVRLEHQRPRRRHLLAARTIRACAAANNTITSANARSTAILSLPAGVTVTYARLYWSAVGSSAAADTTVTLDRVGTGAFSSTITADASSTLATTGMDAANYYQSTADVTALVQTNGAGTYRVSGADVGALVNTKSDAHYAAWWMVVFYQKSTDPPRNLALFDGLTLLDSGSATLVGDGHRVPGADRQPTTPRSAWSRTSATRTARASCSGTAARSPTR